MGSSIRLTIVAVAAASTLTFSGCQGTGSEPSQASVAVPPVSKPIAPDTILFSDNFKSGANPAWGNERGEWRARNGQYDASQPSNAPVTYTDVTTETSLTNFTVRVKVIDITDGGVWIRSSWNGGNVNGVLLVTGGADPSYFNGFYWNVFVNGNAGGNLGEVSVPGLQGSTATIRIVVKGSKYELYYPASATTPTTTLTDTTYSSGSAGLYDFSPRDGLSSPRGERFTNFSISGR